MGLIINSVLKTDNGQLGDGVRFGRGVPDCSCLGTVSQIGPILWPRLRGFTANAASNLDQRSKACIVMNEGRREGRRMIAFGDFDAVVLRGGLLVLYIASVGFGAGSQLVAQIKSAPSGMGPASRSIAVARVAVFGTAPQALANAPEYFG